LQDDDVVAVDEVDKAMFVVDASGPAAGKNVPKLLGFADAAQGVPENIVEEAVDASGDPNSVVTRTGATSYDPSGPRATRTARRRIRRLRVRIPPSALGSRRSEGAAQRMEASMGVPAS
jgi:hypothetical protein